MKTSIQKGISLDVETIPLSNGSTLYFKPMEGAPRVALGVYTYGGNRLEPLPGVADMVDDLLCEGTQKRSAEQIAVEVDSLSMDMDTDTRRDYSVLASTFLEEDFEDSAELLSDMMYHSTLAEFEKEKIRMQGELVMDLDSPRTRAQDLLMTQLLKDTPYQASHSNILNTLPTMASVSPLKDYYQSVYQPGNTFFTMVGDISSQKAQSIIEQHFTHPSGDNYATVKAPEIRALSKNEYLTTAKNDTSQMHLFKGWFAPQMSHPDYPAMVVLNTILGGAGLTSRLFLELRDKQGLAYVVRSQYEASRYLGLFTLYIGTDPNNREKALKGFGVECQKLMDVPVSAKELDEAKENINGRRVVFLETASQQCAYIGNQLALGLSLPEIEQLIERIQSVTSQDVQSVAQQYLSQPSIVTAVGPENYL